MKRWLKYFIYCLSLLLLFLAIGFFAPSNLRNKKTCKRDTTFLFISSNGYHTSFVLPVNNGVYDWHNDFEIRKDIQFLEFGWGNQEFYMSRNFSLKATLRALLPSKTVVHVAYINESPDKWFLNSKNKKIHVCSEDYMNIISYIKGSFATDSNNHKIYLGRGLYGPSEFYKGNGQYHAFQTCNTWVAEGLRKGHLPTPLWSGTTQAVMWHLRNCD